VIYESGSYQSTHKGEISNRRHTASFKSSTHHTTKLAQHVAPPRRKEVGKIYKYLAVAPLIGAAILSHFLNLSRPVQLLLFVAALLILFYSIKKKRELERKYSKEVYKPAFNEWNRSVLCQRCGQIYCF
jgi:Ca2+/Na+ antiporter